LDSALKYISKAHNLAKLIGPYVTKESCFGDLNLAKIFIKRKNFEAALLNASNAIKQSMVNNYADVKCYGYYRAAMAFEGLQRYDSAFHYFDLALKQAQNNDLKNVEANILRSKAYLALELDQFEEAANSLEEYSRKQALQTKRNQSASVSYLVERAKEAQQKISELEKNQIKTQEQLKQRNLWIFIAIILFALFAIGILLFFWNQRRTLRQRFEAEKIEKELMQSLIRTINSQMNPHFVFNALNSVQDLILQKDIRNSNIYLGKFADLMRQTLDYSQKNTISLNQELDTIKLYLELEKLRFGEEFSFEISSTLDAEELQNKSIPSLLLQPYIENAIKHGLLHKTGDKKLTINITKVNNKLQIAILDNGIGREQSKVINARREQNHTSFAMKANEQRLKLVKESLDIDISLEIIDLQPSGTKIQFTFN